MFTKDSRILNNRLTVPLTSVSKAVGDVFKPTLNQLIKPLFANGEQGFAYDPNDLTTLYQGAAGTVPITAADHPVGLMLDKSKGLVLGSNLNATGSSGWSAGAEWGISGDIADLNAVGTYTNLDKLMTGSAVVGRFYEIKVKVLSITGQLRCIFSGSGTFLINTAGNYKFYIYAATSYGLLRFQAGGGVTASISLSSISVKELSGNHAYQTTSAARPILRDAPRRIDYDTVDDKLITTLPAQLTGCTVVRAVPNVGTQILTNQTIPTPYNDNTDHCGLIVINRALTTTETSQITKLFNKAAGV